ncbi:MAG: SigB/SigF/SigG family RNA polymerase sigma factor [Clostridiales Family XIII bacterium]|jgi:RNA polymerase sigma-B factor|nr:SigB/SigF/SigG family RNA polymerase sigma factor [Clostridiales Family XIII bacterium]
MAQTPEEKRAIAELFRKYRETPTEELRNELVEKHLYLAEILARKYSGRGVDYDDLYQVASYALVLAIERYDPDKGVQFSSFATPTIIGEIKKYFRDTAWSLKVPRRLKEIAMRIPSAKERLLEELGRVPTVPELAAEMGVPEEEILEALESSRAYSTYSLEQEAEEAAEAGDSPIFEKYLGTEEKGYDAFDTSSVVKNVMAELSDTEKEVMRKRFLQEMTQREVAEALGLSQMTVSRIEKAMRAKFRAEYNR